MNMQEVRVGDVVAGKYRVRQVLGRGRGWTLDCSHAHYDQRVIVRLVPAALVDGSSAPGWLRAADALARARTEHLAHVIDSGSLPDGSIFVAREWLDGQDLATAVRARRAFPVDEAAAIALQICVGLAHLHARNIVVREVAPQHVFLVEGGRTAKLIDFGLLGAIRADAGGANTSTTIMATSNYTSPELLRREPNIDARSDLWSVGVILYELVTGQPPFAGDALAIMREEPTPASRTRPGVSSAVDGVIAACLAKDRGNRPADAATLASMIAPLCPAVARTLLDRVRATAGGSDVEDLATSDLDDEDAAPTRMGNFDDAMRALQGLGAAPSASASGSGALQGEKTTALGMNFVPVDPRPNVPATTSGTMMIPAVDVPPPRGGAPAPLPSVPPPASLGGTVPFAPAVQIPTAGGSNPSMPGAPAQPSRPEWMTGSNPGLPSAAPAPAPAVGAPVGTRPTPPSQLAKKSSLPLFVSIGAAAALLVGGAIFVLRPKPESDTANADGKPSPAATTAAATASPTPVPTMTGEAQAPGTSPPSTPEPTPTTVDLGEIDIENSRQTRPTGPGRPTSTSTLKTAEPAKTSEPAKTAEPVKPAEPTKPPEPTKPSNEQGTLMAIAKGGTCAFSVNGQSKGTATSLRLSVPAGNYTVTCKPATGATKSKSVQVKGGATATASFQL
jgi:serine/threonine-protein kinase